MLNGDTILNELTALSPLVASINRANVYEVDKNYFNGIRAELQARIVATNFTKEADSFKVPVGYFENLPANILAKIKSKDNNELLAELELISPLVASIGNANVFTVPSEYFENIQMLKMTTAKVVKMSSRIIFKYAAAAVVVGLLGIGGYKFMESNKTDKETLAVVQAANKILETNSFDATLATISDNDIEKYLTQHGEDVNAALVAASTDDVALPEASDYLLDEKTLDNFLNENNLKN